MQKGSLSLRSRFLALSIRKFIDHSVKVIAAVPDGEPDLDSGTLGIFAHCRVDIMKFSPTFWNSFGYAIGNKLDAACLSFKTRYALFLDTDTIFLKNVNLSTLNQINSDVLAANMMGAQVFIGEKAAEYECFAEKMGVNINKIPVRKQNNDGVRLVKFPMFNSGVVLFNVDKGFGPAWRDLTLRVLTSDLSDEIKYPYSDQASLSIALAMERFSYSTLPPRWNLPPSSKKEAELLHYFRFPAALKRDESRWIIARLHKEAERLGFNALGELTLKDLAYFRADQ
ncbi:MAG: hypothetical protein KDD60_06420 [Bdellovibrionales bacterium]|nr:hypothetical protein [Bdellovibrionales bacterium]